MGLARRFSPVLILLLAACAGASGGVSSSNEDVVAEGRLQPSDVSVLFPLPKRGDLGLLLGAESAGKRGELLPDSVFAELPPLAPAAASRSSLRVVSVRFDPCFAALDPHATVTCHNQIRLVLQPMESSDRDDLVHPKDAAVHAFYTLTREALLEASRAVLLAKQSAGPSPDTALGIHPLLERQGLGGSFATALRAIVLEHAGAQNLSRVTFMTRELPRTPTWKFGGFDIDAGALVPIRIASLGEVTSQTFSTLGRNGNAVPAIQSPDDISLFFNEFNLGSPALADQAYTAVLRILNPTTHTPESIDCVSCHTATSAKIWAEKQMAKSPDGNPASYDSTFDLSLTKSPSAQTPENLHAFGYFFDEVSVSQRTANESAATADLMNALLADP